MNQILNMILRMVIHRVLRIGIDKGAQALTKPRRSKQQQPPNDPNFPDQ